MRCSKCQYISFDNSDRCRNCGYEFSLAADADALDLPIRTGDEPAGPLADLSLADLDALEPLQPPAPFEPAPKPAVPPRREPAAPARRSATSGELPLFRDRGRDDDAPLVSLPASPRAPVAVRKSTASPTARRPTLQDPALDLGLTSEEEDAPRSAASQGHRAAPERAVDRAEVAPLVPRALAALIDISLLSGIDAFVLYFTLKLCGLEFALGDLLLIPLMPFTAFIVLLNGGYVTAFTAAGGQTIGKMLTGVRVVTSEEEAWTDRVPVGSAALRAVGYLISALPIGLGFLPVLFGAERRGLHDRLAHTRVVKA